MTDRQGSSAPGEGRPPRRRRGNVVRFGGPRRSAAGGETPLVEVHRCSQAEAVVVRSLFESERIPAVVRSHVTHSVHPFTVGQQGQAVILVPEAEARHARRLLRRLRTRRSSP
jgi:hypothetical protein